MASTGKPQTYDTNHHSQAPSAPVFDRAATAMAAVADAIGRMRYGAVQLTVHDGQVVQLEVTERTRFV